MPNTAHPHPDQIVAIHKKLVEAGGDFSVDAIGRTVSAHYGDMPHPKAPSLKVKDYPAFERVAWMLNDRKPRPADVVHAHKSLQVAGISPAEFEQTWTVARPVANRLLNGRDPTMVDIQRLKEAHPRDIHRYYLDHPFPGYEEVTAHQMATHYRAAEAIARQYGRTPNYEEVSRFAVAGYEADDMHQHYRGTR
jgi:hypothetical protein